jgi:hypothetical protein
VGFNAVGIGAGAAATATLTTQGIVNSISLTSVGSVTRPLRTSGSLLPPHPPAGRKQQRQPCFPQPDPACMTRLFRRRLPNAVPFSTATRIPWCLLR